MSWQLLNHCYLWCWWYFVSVIQKAITTLNSCHVSLGFPPGNQHFKVLLCSFESAQPHRYVGKWSASFYLQETSLGVAPLHLGSYQTHKLMLLVASWWKLKKRVLTLCCCYLAGVTTSAVAWGIALPGSMWSDPWKILQCLSSLMKANTAIPTLLRPPALS